MNETKKKRIAILLVIFFAVLFFFTAFGTFLVTQKYAKLRERQLQLDQQYSELVVKYNKMKEENEELHRLQLELENTNKELDQANTTIGELNAALEESQAAYTELSEKYEKLAKDYASVCAQMDALSAKFAAVSDEHAKLTEEYNTLKETFDLLSAFVNVDDVARATVPGIVCFGDSLTAGNVGSGGEVGNLWSFPLQIQQRLHNELSGAIAVSPYGWSGYSSSWIVNNANITLRDNWHLKNYIFVIWIGTNGGWSLPVKDEEGNPVLDENGNQKYEEDVPTLIGQIDAILSNQLDKNKRFLVIGLTEGKKDALDSALQNKYGDKFVNIREYLSTEGMTAAGMTPTQDDLEMMAKGLVPYSLRKIENGHYTVHYTDTGYTVIGNYLYERMDALGYFDTVKLVKNAKA